MGAINYGTSNYITLGVEPVNLYDLLDNPDFMDYCMQEYPESDPETIAREEAETIAETDRANAEAIMEKYSFYYWHVVLKSGYYDGFYLDIEANMPIFFDNCEERQEAMSEIRDVEKLLKELAGVGLVSVLPGWSTKYKDYQDTLKDIRKAVQEMRAETKSTPTYRTWARTEGAA